MLSLVLVNLLLLFMGARSDCDSKGEKYVSGHNTNFTEAVKFLEDNDRESQALVQKFVIAEWNYNINLTEANKKAMLKMTQEFANFRKQTWEKATSFAWKRFDHNETVFRWFQKLSVLGDAVLSDDKLQELTEIIADMQEIYSKAKVCAYNATRDKPCSLSLEPDIIELMMYSRDHNELKHIWHQWRNETGRKMKEKFLRYVELKNEAACLNGFSDAGEFWREEYESDTFDEDVEQLWRQLKPLYEQLHAYVRRKLINRYPGAGIKPDGPMPAHMLGNLFAQWWYNIFDILKPYPQKRFEDVTGNMLKKNMAVSDMFKLSEEFFTSLGLIPMTPEFWNKSILTKPTDRDIVCHASAWDMYDGKDVRIKMCTRINEEDLMTVHHEMGHVEYFLQYAKQPVVFREGANLGFHEAVGDTIALSVSTQDHLKKVGLLDEVVDDSESDINNLLLMALHKIVFLPFAYITDLWRWKVFEGGVTQDKLNQEWWQMRLQYQGVCPPVRRNNVDLDAGSKFHVAGDVSFIRYFVSYVMQFQFHKALCEASGYEGPLFKCDIYQNKAAGKRLSDVLSLGSSKHWTEATKILTAGKSDRMDASAIVEYFEPLFKWLKNQNRNETLGWRSDDPMVCP